jgi:hypothetical protein
LKQSKTILVKKLIFSALKKMSIRGVKWHFSALSFSALKASITAVQPCTAQMPTFSAEKNGATLCSAEKNGDTWRKVALFSATALAHTFFH